MDFKVINNSEKDKALDFSPLGIKAVKKPKTDSISTGGSKRGKQKNNTVYKRKRILDMTGAIENILPNNIKVYTTTKPQEPLIDYESVIKFDSTNPASIIHIEPPLFEEFRNTISGLIDSQVYIHQFVKLKSKFDDGKGVGTVTELRFGNLGNMTVIIAKLDDNREYLSYYLTKINNTDDNR